MQVPARPPEAPSTQVKPKRVTATFFDSCIGVFFVLGLHPALSRHRDGGMHERDFTQPQELAEAARARGVQRICYGSVSAPNKRCAAVHDVEALE